MADIQIIETEFAAAAAVAGLLARRRVRLQPAGASAAGVAVFVCSARHEAALGGTPAVTSAARAAGARSVVIVEEGAATLAIAAEMGGRLLRVALPPAAGQPAHRDAALLTLADLLASQVSAMVAADAATGALIDLAARVARTDVTVFVNGPTGSGKEVLARKVHEASRRAGAPFIAINCAAIPENMLEAMLFGHEKGAFTGASGANKGIIRAAEGGTLLLDEVSEMPMGLQSKLLRVLQERRVTPLGSQTEVPVDVRIIATSNRHMPDEVRARRFREDLWYRLNVFPLATKPLCEREDDIPALAVALLRRHCPADIALPTITPEAFDTLLAHDWPGNVRELENVIQRALVLHEGGRITPADIVIDAVPVLPVRPLHLAAV
ncbi:sigma-54 dependent transcriptional regulator [Cereibacter sphaeroides]|uniref:sigma 54-interacting transcriptional regulator n=1 Tax=Cereibacter sphaeroides TaxID=1063 RepID=UPI001F48C242|nr:sigma-54 dependent transcriptional regulator [Cereibacter sphaeroides]MCE6961922.1 sigma-54 dependent transcriptional regulator [Cereibacter sphaeroides]MCE6970697.1 sigma-54 dependent transcriptional regulator [Cereibacter sphaeroides]MCE6975707.1 sigma-54 dependent transcriptional regulator [Cereibacter sphaeroides]